MTRADKILTFIDRHVKTPDGALVGTPLQLLPFQVDFIRAVYDNPTPGGTKRAILSVPRKQGKTTLLAALLLAHLVGPEAVANGQCISAAMSREQASLLFKLACQMVRQSPKLSSAIKIVESRREMHGLRAGTVYRAIAAEAGTAHGLSPQFCVLDEAGQIASEASDFVSALTTSQGAHANPLFVTISTQAADPSHLLSRWIDDAAASDDPRVVCHVFAAPEGCKLDDIDAIRQANPALGIFRSEDDVLQLAAEAKRMPTAEPAYRNLILNQRVATGSPFVSRSVWESCAEKPRSLEGLEVFGGLDLSTRTDLTALVLMGKDDGGTWNVFPYFWTPREGMTDRERRDRVPYSTWEQQGFLRATPGKTVDYEYVARDIIEICDGLNLNCIAFDPHRIDFLRKEFERHGHNPPLVPCFQGFNHVNPGICNLEAELLNRRVRHGAHPVLQMCAAGAVTETNAEGQRRFTKRKSNCRIDGLVALAMAFGAAFRFPEPEYQPTYEIFFI